eukprot:TRINITY_DN36988_c0_g1_i2.p1 TRINITY_DN36988_c0_g1~~TRINITY_DN36988_c0_g1_i2.p1  ORF type:complete len:354 (-),score=31.43 TRINITY_DN36988_c0_g1_i2:145-1206(-)
MSRPPAPPNGRKPRNFKNGLLAHLVMVPSWTISPGLLMGGLIGTGAPHGPLGCLATMGLGLGLMSSYSMKSRGPLCLVVLGVGYAAPAGRRIWSTAAAVLVSIMAVLCKGGLKGDWRPRPRLWSFCSRWCRDYYDQAELRGALETISRDGKSCFAFHPHGVLAAGFTVNGCYNPEFMERAGRVNWLCDWNLRYMNPGFRWLCDSVRHDVHNIDGADRKSFQKWMAKGENVAFIPGGFQDAVAAQYGKDCTVLKQRKGFIKYLLQYGYRRFRMKISEYNVPMAAFFGWFLFPMLPRPQSRVLTYVGQPIQLPKIEEPTREDVDKWHGEYCKALQKLFSDYRVEAGFPTAHLEIV